MASEKETKKLELWQKYALALAGVITALGIVVAAATGTWEKVEVFISSIGEEKVEESK